MSELKSWTVLVRNTKKRNYNGIKYMQIRSISADQLPIYLRAGFQQMSESGEIIDQLPENPVDENVEEQTEEQLAAERKLLIDYLVSKGVSVNANIGMAKLRVKAAENGYETPVNEEGLADNANPDEESDDLEDKLGI